VSNAPDDPVDALAQRVAVMLRSEMRKCEPSANEDPCATRARKIYADAVRLVGGESVVAKSEGVHRTTVLRRQQNPNIAVHLSHCIALPEPALRLVIAELSLICDEKLAVRRAG
jgi:hypothetical protein